MSRRAVALLLLLIAAGTAALVLDGREGRSAAAAEGALAPAPDEGRIAVSGQEEVALHRVAAATAARRRGLDPWPGLSGDWMYRCAVELRPQGALEEEDLLIHVAGPGLPHRGWTGMIGEDGALLVPELAIGSEYSFTIPGDLWLLPAYGLDVRSEDRFMLEPYAGAGPQGALGVMRVEFRLVKAGTRVRITDEHGAGLDQILIVALQGERVPARLLGGEWRWSVVDGTIPLPVPDGYEEVEPFLRVLEPPGEFLDQPLSVGLIEAAAQSGSLAIERAAPGSRLRFAAVHFDGRPAVTSVAFDAEGKRELARPDWSGRFDFTTRERRILVRTPGYPDAVGLFSVLANDEPILEEWPQVLVTKPGTITVRIEGLTAAGCWPAQLEVETTEVGAIELTGSRSRLSTFGEGWSSMLTRFDVAPQVQLESSVALDLRLRLHWWGRLAEEHELQIMPESDQELVIRAASLPGSPLRILVSDARGAPIRRANISLRHPDPDAFTSRFAAAFSDVGATAADGTFLLPLVAPECEAELRVATGSRPSLVIPLREVQARSGAIMLADAPATPPGGTKHE